MPKISVLIITLNEERNIERCIRSVQAFADEVIVVDSISTDLTKEIAERLGARVVEQPFPGHIEQKNYAITLATHPLIFSLDADEEVSNELCRSILAVKEKLQADGYTMKRLTNYCGQWIYHSGWYPDIKLRLFDSCKGKWAGMNPHDKVELISGSRIQQLKGHLNHYSYYSVSEHVIQSDKFSQIAARSMFKAGRKGSVFHMLFNPCFKFIRNYFFRLGFLDGFYGLVICRISAFETFLKYARLRELKRKQNTKMQIE